ncbi:MAG: flagellar export chaperone FliS [bacterium]
MASDPASAYKSTQIETASQGQILLMLYDGAIKRMKQARDALENENYQRSHSKLVNVQDIVTELMATLDMEVGGEIAENLHNLYDYVLHNLVQANVKKDPELVDEVIPVMQQLHEAWSEIINEEGMTVQKARSQVSQSVQSSSAGQAKQQNSAPANSNDESKPAPNKDKGDSADSSSSTSIEDTPYGNISIQG